MLCRSGTKETEWLVVMLKVSADCRVARRQGGFEESRGSGVDARDKMDDMQLRSNKKERRQVQSTKRSDWTRHEDVKSKTMQWY
jgi:hypothetical protein